MSSIKKRIAVAVIIALSLAPSVFSQETPQPATAPMAKGPDYVESTGFKGKVFDIKYRDPRSLIEALRPLGSGFKGATISFSDEFKTLTVRDFPENIVTIEEALKRLDNPRKGQPDIELRMHVLIATNAGAAENQYQAEIADVVKQLQSTLSYKSYSTIATIVQRVKDGSYHVSGRGSAEIAGRMVDREQPVTAQYTYGMQSVSLVSDSSGVFTVQLRESSFELNAGSYVGSATIRTGLSVRDGEKVVVGTVTLGNKGLILVLSAKIAKS